MTTEKKRVLIIDDDASLTGLLRLNLHHVGRYTAETVNDPIDAVPIARRFSPDVILLDVMMPGMDGGEVANRLRAVPGLKDVPIVFMTAAATQGEVESKSGCIGGLRFLAKPVRFTEIVNCLDKACAHPCG